MTRTLVSSINETLRAEMARDDRIVLYGQDVARNGGVFRVTTGLHEEFGPRRCFDTPLAESGIVGTAVGMAVAGLRPVVEIQFSGFAWPAFNQIVSHVARIRNRTQGALQVPMVIRMPYGGGVRALEHHSESMEATFAHIPGLSVVIPSTPHDAKGLLSAAIRHPDPVIFMEPKRVYQAPRQEVPDGDFQLPIGQARVETKGTDITIVSYGAQMKEVRAAAALLAKTGVAAEVIDLRTIYPYDAVTVTESVRETGRLLVVHEGPRSFGVAAEIMAEVTEEAFLHLEAPPTRLTGTDTIVTLPRSERYYMVSPDHIVKTARALVSY